MVTIQKGSLFSSYGHYTTGGGILQEGFTKIVPFFKSRGSLNMRVIVDMILTVAVVALALGAVAEFQLRIRILRSAAYRTAMSSWHLLHRLLVSRPSVHLGR